MILYHETDIAIEPIDERDKLEKSIQINDEFYIPSCAKGIIKLVHSLSTKYKQGTIVYFDPRMMVEIKELNLVIVDEKAVLLKTNAVSYYLCHNCSKKVGIIVDKKDGLLCGGEVE